LSLQKIDQIKNLLIKFSASVGGWDNAGTGNQFCSSSKKKLLLVNIFTINTLEDFSYIYTYYLEASFVVFFIVAINIYSWLKKNNFIIYNKTNDEKKPNLPAGVPAQGENPEWDAFLADVLAALGLTLAEVSGALIYEIWLAYQTLVLSGNAAGALQIILEALQQLGILLPGTLPIFLLVAIIFFLYRFTRRELREAKIREDREKKRIKKNDEILEKFDKVLESEGFKSYLKSWGYLIRKTLEKWIKS